MALEQDVTQKEKESFPAIYEASTGNLLPVEQRRQLVLWAKRRGLNAHLGHVCLYFGHPWITIDGWYYLFRKTFPGGDLITRPLTESERIEFSIGKDIHAWRADTYERAGGWHLAMGYGYARSGEEPLAAKSAVEPKWPWRMAEKRAEEDALRKTVPLDISSEEIK